MKPLLITFFAIFLSVQLFGQRLENSKQVVYMKGNQMYDELRYDEAVRLYNRVLNDDPDFNPALLMRAQAKYKLNAYKGVKKDLMRYIENAGISEQIIELMANTEFKMKNYSQAKSYAELGVELDIKNSSLLNLAGDVELELSHKEDACYYWQRAARLGSKAAELSMQVYCGGMTESEVPQKNAEPIRSTLTNNKEDQKSDILEDEKDELPVENKVDKVSEQVDRDRITVGEVDRPTIEEPNEELKEMDEGGLYGTNREPEEKEEPKPEIDMTSTQEINIDEDLKIVIGDGLGDRKIDDYPSIFMLSDVPGNVVVDLCVDRSGMVISAEINEKKSTVLKQGLVSLALRKSKEFGFFPAFSKQQCGTLTFVITN